MNGPLERKVKTTIRQLKEMWVRTKNKHQFVVFSTGKDSLAMTAMLYEAVGEEKPICLYSHHNLEFSSNLEYLETLRAKGFHIQTVHPFLEYFELIERGMGFVTLVDAWCVPMLVGTGLIGWLQERGAGGPHAGVMFRGMSGSEYSHKYHTQLELYHRLDLPCFNPLLQFSKEEILEVIKFRYGLPLNPIYKHMDRTYCICCYTSDTKRQAYSSKHYPDVCQKYYGHIEEDLFKSGLIEKSNLASEYKTREEKLDRHGFVYWRRSKMQNIVGAIKRRHSSGILTYKIKSQEWIATKHLLPVQGHWIQAGDEIRFWDLSESICDTVIKRMINCLDCGFCTVECFSCRRFDRNEKKLRIDGCIRCGRCLRLKFCMGWRHRFWRRVIRE